MRAFCAGISMTAEEWLAVAALLFGREVPSGLPQGGVVLRRDPADSPVRFWCMHCDRAFAAHLTPQKCPHCGGVPDGRGVLLTVKGHTQQTFAFAVSEDTLGSIGA